MSCLLVLIAGPLRTRRSACARSKTGGIRADHGISYGRGLVGGLHQERSPARHDGAEQGPKAACL
jgi:hypothetical protein